MVAMKFNCFFLMPFLDEFPVFLRNELDQMYNSDMGEMFDIAEARMVLQQKRYSLSSYFAPALKKSHLFFLYHFRCRSELMAECEANSKLQRRFDQINAQLRKSGAPDTFQNPLSDQADYEGSMEDMGEDILVPEPSQSSSTQSNGAAAGSSRSNSADEFGFPTSSSMGSSASNKMNSNAKEDPMYQSSSQQEADRDDPWQSLRKATEDSKLSMEGSYSDDGGDERQD